jgi:hypothetical protein
MELANALADPRALTNMDVLSEIMKISKTLYSQGVAGSPAPGSADI